jgi:hypothetical protein
VKAVDLERKGSEGGAMRKMGKSGGVVQIPTADGAPVLGRATGRLAWEGGVRLRWLKHGGEGKGRNGDGTAVDVHFE